MIAMMPMAEAPKTKKTDLSRKVRRNVFGVTLHGWEQLMLLALGATGLVAIAVALTTTSVVILQRHETAEAKRELEEYKVEAGTKISTAEAVGLAAKADIAKANVQIAEANARALEAQAALERFKAPRILTEAQQTAAVAALLPFAGMPFDFSVNPTPEPSALMGQIARILVRANWKWEAKKSSGGLQFGSGTQPASGLMPAFVGLAFEIDVSKTEWQPALVTLTDVFRRAGIDAKANVANDGSASPDAIHIYVGAKP
jgi:hypothetical protein